MVAISIAHWAHSQKTGRKSFRQKEKSDTVSIMRLVARQINELYELPGKWECALAHYHHNIFTLTLSLKE